MSMVDLGIRLTGMGETISGPAKQAANGLQEIVKAQEDIQKSFPKEEMQAWKDIQKSHQQAVARQNGMGAANAGSKVGMPNLDSIARKTGGTFNQLGKGDAVGAGSDALSKLGGALKKAGPVGMGIAAVGGIAFAGNILSKQYEAVMEETMSLAAVLGDLGTDTKSNSLSFKSAMKEASESAQEFGYNLKVGSSVMKGLSKEGVSRGGIDASTSEILGYARGLGVSPDSLTKYEGMGRKFGMKGNLLGVGYGGLEQSGMGAGRFQEYLSATLSIFESGISEGVVKGFSEISATQNYFSQLGEMWKGSMGAHRIGKLSGAVRGSTGLQSESDVIMYRAAQSITDGGSYIDVMKTLEKGMNSKMFLAITGQIDKLTGGHHQDQVEMFKQVFKVNYTEAGKLLELSAHGKSSKAVAQLKKAPGTGDTDEVALLRANEGLSEHMREAGSGMIGVKRAVVEGAESIVDALAEFLMADVTAAERRDQAKKMRAVEMSRMGSMLGISNGVIGPDFPSQTRKFIEGAMGGMDPLMMSMEEMGFAQFLAQTAQTPGGGGMFNYLAGMGSGTKKGLLKSGAFSGKMMPMLEGFGESDSAGGRKITMDEFNQLIKELRSLVKSVDNNTNAEATFVIKPKTGSGKYHDKD